MLEMMYEPQRVKLAVDAALSTGLPVFFGMSARRAKDGNVVSFHHFDDLPISDIASLIPKSGIDAAGLMHTGSEIIGTALEELKQHFKGPLMVYPDSGYFEMPGWRFVDIIPPHEYSVFARQWLASGVQLLGGCCGLGLPHIEEAVRVAQEFRKSR